MKEEICPLNKTILNKNSETNSTITAPKTESEPPDIISDTERKKKQEELLIIRKQKRKEYLKKYNQLHKEEKIIYHKEYRKKNQKKISAYRKKYLSLHKKETKEYYHLNKEKIRIIKRKHAIKNKTRLSAYYKEWRKRNREWLNLYARKRWEKNKHRFNERLSNRRKTDLNYRLKHILRGRLYTAISGNYKSGSAVNDLGCSIEQLKIHLESKFQPGMSWKNYGKWHIDHIRPLNSFNLSNREELLIACRYTNLQPLWAKDNLSKGDKIISQVST